MHFTTVLSKTLNSPKSGIWAEVKATLLAFPGCVGNPLTWDMPLMISMLVGARVYQTKSKKYWSRAVEYCIYKMFVCVSTPVSPSSCILASLVVSEMPHESLAHRPVEMLPLICSRDQRKAAQLQVREHTSVGLSMLKYSSTVKYMLLHTFFLLEERRWRRHMTLPWIKLAWK